MKKFWEKIGAAIRHNQGMAVAIVICIGLCVWAFGCESKVKSLNNPEVLVSRGELEVEIDSIMATAEMRIDELDKQEAIKRKLFELAVTAAETGTFNPAGIISLVGWILFGGTVVDNRRKDGVIKGGEKAKTENS